MSDDVEDEATLRRIAELAGIDVTGALVQAFAALDPSTPADYRALAVVLVSEWSERMPRRVGLGGGQGAGKSTLASLVEAAGDRDGMRIAVLSLDDFYLGKARRREIAARVHPLFETRGPPGTHDIDPLRQAMDRLFEPGETLLPVFDKGLDDRVAPKRVRGPFDLVLLEGWCVGARAVADADLGPALNDLEAEQDPRGDWRRTANERLAGDYAELWAGLDELVYLCVPDRKSVV